MALTILITNAGRAALLNADKSGTRAVRIASVGVSPTAITPAATATTLPGEIKRITTLSGDQVAADMIHLVVRDEGDAVYTVRSFALYLDDGTLFAIYGQADVIVEKSAQALLLLAVDVVLKDIAASSITFGNTNFLLPPATTERQGLVELATDAEAAAMLDAVRALTPRGASLILTAANILSRLLTVDGAGSGLDADLVRGRVIPQGAWLEQSGIAPANVDPDSLQVGGSAFSLHASLPVTGTVCYVAALAGGDVSDRGLLLASPYATGDLYMRSRPAGWIKLWSATNDGAGSGLDADLLDGQDGSFYSNIVARLGYTPVQMGTGSGQLTNIVKMGWSGTRLKVTVDATDHGNVVFDGHIADVWRSSNDGAGSGLDADLLDGQDGSFYSNIVARLGYTPVQMGTGTGQLANIVKMGWSGTRLKVTVDATDHGNIVFDGHIADVWRSSNDGAGSGLDADLLDGQDGSFYSNIVARLGYTPVQMGTGTGQLANIVKMGWSGTRLKVTVDATDHGNIVFDGHIADVWRSSNDGAGSGLDADMVDGWQRDDIRRWGNLLDRPDSFPPSGHTHGAADIAGAFAGASLAPNGYQMLPNGLILQWGGVILADGSGVSRVTFPVAFPTEIFAHGATNDSGSSVAAAWAGTGDASRTGMAVSHTKSALVASAIGTAAHWWAIGR